MSCSLSLKRPSSTPHPDSLTRYSKAPSPSWEKPTGPTTETLERLTGEYLQLNSPIPTFTGVSGSVRDAAGVDMPDTPGIGIYHRCGDVIHRRGFITAAVMPDHSVPTRRSFKCNVNLCGHESSLEEEKC